MSILTNAKALLARTALLLVLAACETSVSPLPDPRAGGEPSAPGDRLDPDAIPVQDDGNPRDVEPGDVEPGDVEPGDVERPGSPGAVDSGTVDAGPVISDSAVPDTTHPPAVEDGRVEAPGEPGLRCQADAAAPTIDYAKPGPYAVGILDISLSDSTRPIEATEHHAAAPSRVLETRIYYPAASAAPLFGSAPLAADGPFPMVMYSHGYSSNSEESATSGRHAASHGYIVVAPTFPLTNMLANNASPDTRDIPNQPGDISFLIDRMIEFSADPNHLLAGSVDPDRIGAMGVSAGGLTTLLVSLHAKYHDPRIRVAMPVAPFAAFFEPPFYHATRTIPLLIVQGDMDAFLPYEINGRRAFEYASPNAQLITVAKGSHAAFAMPIDGILQQVASALLVPPEWSQDNPDAMGCAAVGGNLLEERLAVLETLEGPHVNHDLQLEGDDIVCQSESLLSMPTMGLEEQRAILAESVVAFFDAHLGATPEERLDGCRHLRNVMPNNPSVTLE